MSDAIVPQGVPLSHAGCGTGRSGKKSPIKKFICGCPIYAVVAHDAKPAYIMEMSPEERYITRSLINLAVARCISAYHLTLLSCS